MRHMLIGFLFIVSQPLFAAGSPVFVDEATSYPVQIGTAAKGRLIAGEIGAVSAEVTASVEVVRVRVGDSIKQGDELVRLDDIEMSNDLKSLEARRQYLEAHLELLKKRTVVREKQLARAQSLTTKDLLTQDASEQAQLNVIQSQSEVVKTMYELEDLRLEIADMERQLENTRVTAQLSGRIIDVSVSDGQYVKPGDPLFRILPDSGVEVEAEVRPEAYESLSVGQIVSGQLRNTNYDLKVRALIAEQNQRTGSRVIRLQFVSPPESNLVLGETIDLRLPIGELTEQVTIAKNAVIPGKEGHRVVLIINGRAEPRKIELGPGVGDRIAVTRGVQPGDIVVTQGQEGLRKGQEVNVVGGQS